MTDEGDDNSLPPSEWKVVIAPETRKAWKAEGLSIDLGASRWAKAIANAMLKHIKKSIRSGQSPAGGGQKPLKPGTSRAEKAAKGKRPRHRGFTEHRQFVNSLRIKSLKRGKRQASYLIASSMPEVFDDWQIRERARGVDYLPVTGDMEKLVQQVAKDLLGRAIAKRAKGATATSGPVEHPFWGSNR